MQILTPIAAQEAERLKREQLEAKKKADAAAELAAKEAEYELKKQMFAGTQAKAEREEILGGLGVATKSKKVMPSS